MKKIAIYSRKSILTDVGDSVNIQVKMIKEYFKNRGIESKFETFIDEGFSGGNTNRPAFKLMMSRIKEFDAVAIYKIDRIARNTKDFFNIFSELEELHVELISITEGVDPSTPGGRMLMTMLAGVAEMERMNTKQRVKDGMLDLARTGHWTGGNSPVGYKSYRTTENGKRCSYLEIDNDTKDIVINVFDLYLDGCSTRKIANKINEIYNISTSPARVSNILYSPIYVASSEIMHKYLELNNYEIHGIPNGKGYLTYRKTRLTEKGNKVLNKFEKTIAAVSKHKSIIDENTWINVQEKLKKVTQDPKPRKSQFTFLAHMVKCGYCGAPMRVYSEQRCKSEPQRFFRKFCTCNHIGVKFKNSRLTIERAEASLLEHLETIDLNGIEKYIRKGVNNTIENKLSVFNKELKKIDKKIDGLTDRLALASENTIDILMKKLEDLVIEKNNIQEKILIINKEQDLKANKKSNSKILKNNIHSFINNFDSFTLEEKQNKIQNIIECLEWYGAEQELHIRLLEP
ncbi:recombinase family protein [Clostridium botulinum]|nr:recombinase family protein [Clostridium botulinum]